jgi:predicted TIM-barrel fold metal-dependent hydrolase
MLDRRELLSSALAGAAAAGLRGRMVAASTDAPSRQRPPRVIDTNVSLFQWPFRRLPLDETNKLVRKLYSHAIAQAWTGSFEGLLHRDIAGVNTRLADACREQGTGLLIPFGSVNPALPDWEEDLRRCHEEHHMPGIRLHPNYHEYELDDPRFETLLQSAAERGLIVQLAAAMEDRRTQHRLLQAPDVDLTPLPEILGRVPQAKVQVLNHKAAGPEFQRLLRLPNVSFDIARVTATDGVARVLRTAPAGRVLFGTHAPFLIYEAAMIKIDESNLTQDETIAVLNQNAEQLMSPAGI